MATKYVGPGGSDSNNGNSWGARYLTIAKAATVVSAGGDIVYVGPGTYRENVTMTVSGGNTYSTGTVSITNGSAVITGSGTSWNTSSNVLANYYIKIPGNGTRKVVSVDSDTQITVDVAIDSASGSGLSYITYNPILWIADYSGANTDGTGGVVRWTGSTDDTAANRAACFTASGVNYNHVTGFQFDTTTSSSVNLTNPGYWCIEKNYFGYMSVTSTTANLNISGASQLGCTIQNNYFVSAGYGVYVQHSAAVNNVYHQTQNNIFLNSGGPSTSCFNITRIGNIYIKNNTFQGGNGQVTIVTAAGNSGQQIWVYNNVFQGCAGTAITGLSTGQIIEDYNSFFCVSSQRSNTATGANSINYPALFDSRWFFEMVK